MPEVVVVQQADEPGRRKGRPKGHRRRRGWRGRRGDGVPAKPRSSRGGGRRCDVNGGDGDVGRRTGDEQQPAGDGEVVATPLDAGEDASPVISPRNGGESRGKEEQLRRREKCRRKPEGARPSREVRLEVAGKEEREGRQAGRQLRGSPRETEGRPGWRRWRRRWRRRRRGRPAHGQGGRGGWRRPAAREREGDGGEVARDHGKAREGAKTRERGMRIPFYRMGERAGHGRGRNGDGNGGRRQR
uniref:OSJNBb0018A10.17 protein n=1 Tax=Oryza sativa subsp. japonica TaxID=39947 RepID=Q4JF11_ORYSJ|nr:OSJNBb0018A10.17 [Oryza sativa Japonica Group]